MNEKMCLTYNYMEWLVDFTDIYYSFRDDFFLETSDDVVSRDTKYKILEIKKFYNEVVRYCNRENVNPIILNGAKIYRINYRGMYFSMLKNEDDSILFGRSNENIDLPCVNFDDLVKKNTILYEESKELNILSMYIDSLYNQGYSEEEIKETVNKILVKKRTNKYNKDHK